MSYIDVTDLTFSYVQGGQQILQDQQLRFDQGTFNVLTGPSGSGKSTFLRLLCGLFPQFTGHLLAGKILLDGQDVGQMSVTQRARKIALLFQVPSEQFAMPTPREELVFTLENLRTDPAEIPTRLERVLAFTGTTQFADRKFTTLSGGEQQRAALSVILALDADIILLDEPFANVDPQTRAFLLKRLAALVSEQGKTVIISDHDLTDYQFVADYLYVLDPAKKQIHLADPAERAQRFKAFDQQKHQAVAVDLPQKDGPVEFALHDFATGYQQNLLSQKQFQLFQGHLTVFTGPNGVGKSTLFNAIAKLQGYRGSLTWHEQEIAKLKAKHYNRKVALVFQNPVSQFMQVTVKEELELSLKNRLANGWTKDQVQAALVDLDLAGRQEQVVYQLSEGQKRKLQILLMLLLGVPTLLLDEPLTGLDLVSANKIMGYLQRAVKTEGKTVIMISHQLTNLAQYADYHIKLDHKELSYEATL
ncbi:energy-coupling factor transporter ATP-binding protein [Ligilactobacillus salitolerans]|uniref:Energy-coupling factor transporter ATP-binding protein n=1 Tax=Ligilactobacillus salitolerans TaxID=1808352 RepID=A0A401IT18_9LACO|nr:ABC transporter ATP-binding protein [Ligilactobacillus salitolerans]GBG94693.1 energy-coupling factor transporter ATP-binding protein [Ligilactobacillus salitolerans]